MTTTYPTSVHTHPNPGPLTYRDDPGFELDVLVANLGDCLEQVQVKLGTGASVPAANQVLRGTAAGASAFGQLVAADVADGALTTILTANGSTVDPTYASGTAADIPQMSITFTPSGPASKLLVVYTGSHANTTASAVTAFDMLLDGGLIQRREVGAPGANYTFPVISIYQTGNLTVAAHTFKMQWIVNAGTTKALSTFRSLYLYEFRK